MRFKHTKTILLIITNLLLLSLLYIGYQKIQRVREQKAYQDQFAKVTQLEKSSEKGKDVQVQEGIIGTSYVTTYYPTKDGQSVEIIKEKIQEDLQRLGSDEKTKEPKHLTFYHSEEAEAPFVGYHPIQIKRAEYQYKKRKFITNFIGEDEPVAFTYTNTDKEIMQNLDTDTKRQILADVYTNLHNTKRDIRLKYLAKAALFVYYCSTPEQQVELFNDLYKIRKDKDIANIRKLLKETNMELVSDGFALLPEISELVKNDILFIKHSQKGQDIIANKKILFEQATRKLQQMISNTMQQQFALNKNAFAKQ